jgi:hypothetical protein
VSVLEVPQIDPIAKRVGITITDMKVTKARATSRVVLILLSAGAMAASPQSSTGSSTSVVAPQFRPAFPPEQIPATQQQDVASREKAEADKARREAQAQEEQRLVQETQAGGYWVDPSSGLMWEGKDNGNDITWGKAIKYCSNLRLAGYSDWRLPTVDELEGIYDGRGFDAPPPANGGEWALSGKAKGGVLLTGNLEWSSSRVLDDRGHRTGYAWQFDFPHGRRWHEPLGYYGSKRALCVRHSGE